MAQVYVGKRLKQPTAATFQSTYRLNNVPPERDNIGLLFHLDDGRRLIIELNEAEARTLSAQLIARIEG